MAEVAGLVIGGVSLVALFETAMTAFDYIEVGATHGQAYNRHVLKERLLKLRLSRWERTVVTAVQASGGYSVGTPENGEEAKELLGYIATTIKETEAIAAKYKVKGTIEMAKPSEQENINMLVAKVKKLAIHQQSETSLTKKARWALRDERRFRTLLTNLESSVTDLEDLFPAEAFPGVVQKREKLTVDDVAELVQPSEIEEPADGGPAASTLLQDAAMDIDKILQAAVKAAVEAAKKGQDLHSYYNFSVEEKARLEAGDYIQEGSKRDDSRNSYGKFRLTGESKVRLGNTWSSGPPPKYVLDGPSSDEDDDE